MRRLTFLCAGLLVLAGACAPATGGPDAAAAPAARPAARDSAREARMVPAGYGTLRQEQITVSLRSGAVLVKLTPLDESTIRLLAPDTYRRLHALRDSRRADAERALVRAPEFFLVSFFSYQPDEEFQPEDVQLVYQSRLLRPQSIMPVTSGWGRQRLGQQETQSAIYVFAGPLEYDQTFSVRYGAVDTDDWQNIVPLLENEKAKVATRGAGAD